VHNHKYTETIADILREFDETLDEHFGIYLNASMAFSLTKNHFEDVQKPLTSVHSTINFRVKR
jgi:hypothetical protein